MSWQAAAFGLLAIALAAGFAWYERDRPDARIVALVGTLAAFAALGRIAFAAVPNVKPTTDIVLIAGYGLGGGPGFAVGAIAGLTSNFFFGQGPWTPWQMAGWGAIGILGAGLARAGLPRGSRWPLAIACCVAGFAFTALQDVGDWVTFSDHSWAQLGVYVGQGLGFDAIHAAGCLGFALLFGPALARSIERFARRLEVTWVQPAPLAVVVAAVTLGAAGLAVAPSRAQAASGPAGYLLRAQNGDGGFGEAPGQPSNQLYTGWAALGLAAAGYDLNHVAPGGHTVVDYVRDDGDTGDVGSLERTILVVRAAGGSARSFGGHDLIAALERRVRGDGSVSDQVNLTAFAVMALRSDGVSPPDRMLAWLEHQQNRDGGFGFAGAGGTSDADDTGAVLEALAAVGGRGAHVRVRATGFLRRQQDPDGGFSSQPGGESNAQSTAWAIQGLQAAGISPSSLHRRGARSPIAFLRSLVGAGGQVAYARGTEQTPVWVTGEALMALDGKPLPLSTPKSVTSGTPTTSTTTAAPTTTTHASAPAHHPERRQRRAPRRARTHRVHRVRRPPATTRQSGELAEAVGILTAVALAPVSAG